MPGYLRYVAVPNAVSYLFLLSAIIGCFFGRRRQLRAIASQVQCIVFCSMQYANVIAVYPVICAVLMNVSLLYVCIIGQYFNY